ncbi:type II secretion system major pseudopilin GspG [Gammaproteobacteria bacterium]|nr:type II secretion system major pseudopilin GspG [Gammaproteobacteria bacterium]
MKKYNKGFTLIELMAVIVILGILTTIVAVNVTPFFQRANFEKVRADLSQIEKAIETFRFQHFSYPTTNQGLEALVIEPELIKNPNLYPDGGYLSGYIPEDPWGNQYLYLSPGQYGKYDLFTYGADGVAGGEGENADIGNWQKK